MPRRVARTTSLVPSVTCTSINSSPDAILMALIPVDRGLPYADSAVFFTTPLAVANMR